MNDALGSPQSVLVLGGSSEIGQSIVRRLASERARLVVFAGRRPDAMGGVLKEVEQAGASTTAAIHWDANAVDTHAEVLRGLFSEYGGFDMVLVAAALLGDQRSAEHDPVAAAKVMTTNYVGVAAALLVVADLLREQGQGSVVVLSSVAGVRVRRSNFIYGSSKAALDGFSQGLADSLIGSGVRLMLVRPGFVHTKMTAGMKAAPLSVTPEAVADATLAGLRRSASVVWVPQAMRPIFAVLSVLPRSLFRRVPG